MTAGRHGGRPDQRATSPQRQQGPSLWPPLTTWACHYPHSALTNLDAEPLVLQVAGRPFGLVPVVVGAPDFPPMAALDEHLEAVVERDARGGGGLGAGGGRGQSGQGPGGDDGGQD